MSTRQSRIARAREIWGQWQGTGTERPRCILDGIPPDEIEQGFVLGFIDLRVLRALNSEYGLREYGGWNESTVYRERQLLAQFLEEAVHAGKLDADSIEHVRNAEAA